MKNKSGYSSIVAFVFCVVSFSANADLPELAPPKVQLVDEFGVNVHSGQVQSSLDTVAIGGAMGLSHSISNFTNNFSIAGYRGYQDKYYAKGYVTNIDTRPGLGKNVMRVHDIGGSADFELIVGGVAVNFATSNPVYIANYSYRALGDRRHLLETRSDGIYWTKPDGTEVKFEKGNAGYPEQVGLMKQIKYPNGFIIDVDYLNKRVTTNTGFALKYIHQYDPADAIMDAAKYGISNSTQVPAINAQVWSDRNPKYVQAINLKVEDCLTSTCTMNWPKAEFKWPAGMPRAIYLGDSTFKVTDATGSVTEYYFRGFDLAYNGTTVNEGSNPNEKYSPRLIGIKPAGSNEKVFQYTYKNIFDLQTGSIGGIESTWFWLSSDAGQVVTAKRYDQSAGYSIGEAYYDTIQNNGSGYIQRVLPKVDAYPGAINSVTTREGVLSYELNYRNFPLYYSKPSGNSEEYEYDARGNMTKITKNGTWTAAQYPADCVSTPKNYCNKPIWTSDAKNNKTWFTYHSSGEVETITYPANENGLVKKVRYEYTSFPASYYSSGAAPVLVSAPIVLKTAEISCANSDLVGNTCAANDQIITRYEYESDNLYMTGMTVEAYDGTVQQRITKRSCYEYDKYGNKIGETQPKSNQSSCSQ